MNELIVIGKKLIGGELIDGVDARELYEKLEVLTQFKDWIVRRIEEAQLQEKQDFERFSSKMSITPEGGRPTIEYALSLDSAKHIAMLERTEKGKEIRQYFIDFEKKAKEIMTKPASLVESIKAMLVMAERQEAIENEQIKQAQQIKGIEAKQAAFVGQTGYYSIVAYAINTKNQLTPDTAKCLGKLATRLSRTLNISIGEVKDPRWGHIGTYHESVLEKVFDDFFEASDCNDYHDMLF